jgi:hypothetical protein
MSRVCMQLLDKCSDIIFVFLFFLELLVFHSKVILCFFSNLKIKIVRI